MLGWVKIQRELTDHWVWNGDPYSKGQAWVDLLLHANYKPVKVNIKGRIFMLAIGQQARSERSLGEQWSWSRTKVRRFLKSLKQDHMIEQHANHQTSIITICNYEKYQDSATPEDTTLDTTEKTSDDTTPEPHPSRLETTTDTQLRSKEVKKGKNKDNKRATAALDFSKWPGMPSDQILTDYKKMRTGKKSPLTQTTIDRMATPLKELNQAGIPINETIGICQQKGWLGLKADWIFKELGNIASPITTQAGFIDKHKDPRWREGL